MDMDYMIANCEAFYPFLLDDAIMTADIGHDELLIETRDGDRYIYDDLDKTFRKVSKDSNDVTEEEFRREFGYRLRTIMFRRGLTQDELSERSGVSRASISSYMRGKSSPTFYTLRKLARAMGCSIEDFSYI